MQSLLLIVYSGEGSILKYFCDAVGENSYDDFSQA